MARSNPVGPTPYPPDLYDASSSATSLSSYDSSIAAFLLGVFGGSIAFLIYHKKFRNNNAAQLPRTNNTVSNNTSNNGNVAGSSLSRSQPVTKSADPVFSRMNDLPAEIRTKIWQQLSYNDRLNLRLTSKFTKQDVEAHIGFNGRITTADLEKYEFFQNIALTSCKINELQMPIGEDFFMNPNVLESLEIREYSVISVSNLAALLSVATGLKHLKIRMVLNEDSTGISRTVLKYLPYMKSLSFLHLKTKTIDNLAPNLKNYLDPLSILSNSLYSITNKLKTLHVEVPDLPNEEVKKWKLVMDRQTCLENFTANFGHVNWRFYEKLLRRNFATLERLVLEGIRGWNVSERRDDPFDWAIFSNYCKLKSIDLACFRGGEHDQMNSINFDVFPCNPIEEFFISRITLPLLAVDRVYNSMPNLQRGYLDRIGAEGIDRAHQLAWIHNGGNERGNEAWWQNDQLWDYVAQGMFGITLAIAFTAIVKTTRLSSNEFGFLGGSDAEGSGNNSAAGGGADANRNF